MKFFSDNEKPLKYLYTFLLFFDILSFEPSIPLFVQIIVILFHCLFLREYSLQRIAKEIININKNTSTFFIFKDDGFD